MINSWKENCDDEKSATEQSVSIILSDQTKLNVQRDNKNSVCKNI